MYKLFVWLRESMHSPSNYYVLYYILVVAPFSCPVQLVCSTVLVSCTDWRPHWPVIMWQLSGKTALWPCTFTQWTNYDLVISGATLLSPCLASMAALSSYHVIIGSSVSCAKWQHCSLLMYILSGSTVLVSHELQLSGRVLPRILQNWLQYANTPHSGSTVLPSRA
jgi:hypothetical protein